MAGENFVSVDGLSIDFDVPGGALHAVRDVSFGIARGETLCIVGESGSGKSMTALGLMGLLPSNAHRSARRLRVGGHDLLERRRRAGRLALEASAQRAHAVQVEQLRLDVQPCRLVA